MVEIAQHYWTQVVSLLAALFTPGVRPTYVARRGAGFIEYVLIALVAIAVFLAFKTQIATFMTKLWAKITGDSGV